MLDIGFVWPSSGSVDLADEPNGDTALNRLCRANGFLG